MKMVLSGVLGVVFSVIASTSTAANGVFYECDMNSGHRETNWVANKTGFVVFSNGAVTVVDQWVMHFMGGPQKARVRKLNGGKLRINWNLTDIENSNGQKMAPNNYSALLNTKSKTVRITVSSSAYSGARITGTGRCQVRSELPRIVGKGS